VLSVLDASLVKAKQVLSEMDDATAMSTWSFTRYEQPLMSMPRISVVRTIMLSHWYHHRWQLSVYPARAQRAGAGDLWARRGRESFRMRH
jgi:hypothetical protein